MSELDAFLDRLTALLSIGSGPLTAQGLQSIIAKAREPEPTTHWSPWLEWRGGPCPLPPCTECHTEERGWSFEGVLAKDTPWPSITSFRYRADNPAGWLPRGEFIPPAELWDEGCPVRCEWKADAGRDVIDGDNWLEGWGSVTHIRLVARQPQVGLPEAQPEPGAEPELPEYVRRGRDGDWQIVLSAISELWLDGSATPDDLERIAEACRILAARERARRAGS